MSSRLDETIARAHRAAAPLNSPEASGSLPSETYDLLARASHYRRLAEIVFDPRINALARDCARELEDGAAMIQKWDVYRKRFR